MSDLEPALGEVLASALTAKKKVKAIAEALLAGTIDAAACAKAAAGLPDVQRGTVLESLELATRTHTSLVDPETFGVLVGHLSDPAPRASRRWRCSIWGAPPSASTPTAARCVGRGPWGACR